MEKFIFLIFTLLLTSSCGKINLEQNGSASAVSTLVSGLASDFFGAIAYHDPSFFPLNSAYAATCGGDTIYAELYALDNTGSLESAYLDRYELGADAVYQFDFATLGISLTSTVGYVVKIAGCNRLSMVPITGYGANDATPASTFVAQTTSSAVATKLNETNRSAIAALISSIGTVANTTGAYSKVDGDANLKASFASTFGSALTAMQESAPAVGLKGPSTNLSEGTAYTFSPVISHFNGSYNGVYEWKLDGVTQATTASWAFTPTKNQQGSHTIRFRAGLNNGGGNIDTTKPYYEKTMTVTVANTYSVSAPSISFGSSYSSTTASTVVIATGASQANCDTFSTLAITEVSNSANLTAGDFNVTCSSNGTQNEAFTLSAGDGTKTVYIYAKDASGNISSAQSATIALDTTNPTTSITDVSGPVRAGQSYSVSLSGSDANLTSLVFEYAQDGSTFGSSVTLSNSATSYSWTVPDPGSDVATAKVRVTATDLAGNTSTSTTAAFTIDRTAPAAPSGSIVAGNYTNSTTVTVTIADCTDRASILVNETNTAPDPDSPTQGSWATCSTTAGAFSYTFATMTEELKTLYIWAKDSAGNVTTADTQTTTLDTTDPSITLSAVSSAYKGNTAYTISWSGYSDTNGATNPYTIQYSTDGGSTWSNGTGCINVASGSSNCSWTTPSADSAISKIRIAASDLAGNIAYSTSSTFTIDSTAPTFTAMSFILNSGSATTSSNYLSVDFDGTDNSTGVSYYCFQYNDTTAPATGDSCWQSVSNNTSVSVSGAAFSLGFGAGVYNVYGWLKDAVGNISSLTNAGSGTDGQDKDSITYSPGTPPTVEDIIAAGLDSPTDPVSSAQRTIASGDDVYIKWKATDAEGLAATPISLYYSTDGTTFTLIASGLDNGQNGACTVDHAGTTVDDTATGCYLWSSGSPANTYYIVKVVAEDSSSMTSSLTSLPLNVSEVNFIAGNTGTGLGDSASSALFFDSSGNGSSDVHSLAVSSTGIIYYRDSKRGILKIDPATGNQNVYIPLDASQASNNGDGGNISSATIKSTIAMIIIDYDDNLLIRETDRIRKVDTTAETIDTFIGGGADNSDNVAVATDLEMNGLYINGYSGFFVLPNGDIYFTAKDGLTTVAAGGKFRKYTAATGAISSIIPSGLGNASFAGQDINDCTISGLGITFNKETSEILTAQLTSSDPGGFGDCGHNAASGVTSAGLDPSNWTIASPHPSGFTHITNSKGFKIQGMNGELYAANYYYRSYFKFNTTTNNWDLLAGANSYSASGFCTDGDTFDNTCLLNPEDIFVTKEGKIYFVDGGLVRVVKDDNTVLTLYGQRLNYGDGGLAVNARNESSNSAAVCFIEFCCHR